MTLLESIVATVISFILVTALVNAWMTDMHAVRTIESESALELCVNNATEAWEADRLNGLTFVMNDQDCQIEVHRNALLGVWVIEAQTGSYKKVLWVP